ncbi:type II toxin-antitoxin system PemK/MazF family toxin [Eisenbergiella tayi]|uniref:type II toxin-antitoxin system PemK/MazF family toxin n=1 Tax=Eisenbergiella tayi TaxID=1432052 RepID=UPI0008485B9D|nr:type II toxin-antitoxin system PemK/MazF family toxin [Eisenbergiella tayi]ODR28286.1 PemK family transcriptional regulator [Eisenbergiella tayi]
MAIQRGDIYYADLTPVVGSEQGGIRPVVIIQNNAGNRYSPTVIVAAITSRLNKHRLPTHIWIGSDFPGLYRNSMVLLEQVRTIDRSRLKEYIGSLNQAQVMRMNRAISISLGLKREADKGILLSEKKEEECCEQEETGMALLPY